MAAVTLVIADTFDPAQPPKIIDLAAISEDELRAAARQGNRDAILALAQRLKER